MMSLGRNSVYKLINSGALPSVMIGGRRLVQVEGMRRLFESK
jgi:hypothetical protein